MKSFRRREEDTGFPGGGGALWECSVSTHAWLTNAKQQPSSLASLAGHPCLLAHPSTPHQNASRGPPPATAGRSEKHTGPSQAPARAAVGLSSRQADLWCFWDTRRGLRQCLCHTHVRAVLTKIGSQEPWVLFSVTLRKPFPFSGPQFPLRTLRALQCYHPALSLCLRVRLVAGFDLSNTRAPGPASQSFQKHPLTPRRPEAQLT